MKNFKLGAFEVKDGGEPIFLPDIGTFFDSNVDQAMQMVKSLSDAGCKIIKGEILHTGNICLETDTIEKYYIGEDKFSQENYKSLIERKVVDLDSYKKIFTYCKKLGMDFVVSIYDFEGVNYAKDFGASALKIATSNITHIPLIRYAASIGLPIILDTGRSSWDEIARAVQTVVSAGNEKLIVEHSPSAPPAPIQKQNLKMMLSLSKAFDVHPGLSDHHSSDEMMYAAVAMGVQIIEKGVCADNNKNDQDVYHAMPIGEVKTVLEKLNNISNAMGTGTRYLKDGEKKLTDRMCIYAKEDLKEGDILDLDKVGFAFPQIGIPAYEWDSISGKKLKSSVKANSVLEWKHIELLS